MNEETNNWLEANQAYLMARLQSLRLLLERHVERSDRKPEDVNGLEAGESWESKFNAATDAINEAGGTLASPAALDHLCHACSLSGFERDLLLLCAGVELDGNFAALCAAAQGDARRTYATFSLALATLPGAHWNALTPASALRRWRLVDITRRSEGLLNSQLSIDERVLHYLAGISYLDDRLKGLIEPISLRHQLPASHQQLALRIAEFWASYRDSSDWPAVLLCGSDQGSKRGIAGAVVGIMGLNLHVVSAADIPASVSEREALARLWEREALLLGSALLVEQNERDVSESTLSLIDELRGMIFISVPESLRLANRSLFRIDVTKPSPGEQETIWRDALGPFGDQLNGELTRVISQFSLGTEDIHGVGEQVRSAGAREAPAELADGWLWNACRRLARPRLDNLAQRIRPMATWQDLILPELQLRALHDLAAFVRQRAKVYETWGFSTKGERGLGISALFAGASGTGKTMAAEVLAGDLQLDLYRIDLSQVVSKYIGETEKNLRRVFEAAEEGGAILLFDEADALFGKRSEVKDSHDRYANIEVSYLLQQMEAYRGLAILTTNLKNSVDSAFLRRLRFVIQFPFPDNGQRAQIWQRIFPPATPVAHIDIDRLARLSIPGGNIHNIALQAAFIAADADESVSMAHLLRAARNEYAKLERPLTEAEIGGWS
jgi:hypothetical protein